MTNKYILIVYGPMCAGKTTAIKEFLKLQDAVCHIPLDKIKRFISDFSPEKYSGVLNEIAFGLAESAVKNGLSLVVEGNIGLQNRKREMYKNLATTYGLSFFECNIEAPLPILTDRFFKRVSQSLEKGSKVSVTNIDGMLQRYNKYLQYKKNNIPLIDSSLYSSEIITQKLLAIITK